MIRCPYIRDAVIRMLPTIRDDERIARLVSNSAYRVRPAEVRSLRCRKHAIG